MAPLSSTVVVVGAEGEVGRAILAELSVREELRLVAVDLGVSEVRRTCDRSRGDVLIAGDITDPPAEIQFALAVADAVVLAVPEQVAEVAAVEIFDRLAPGTLVVDTLSVKTRWFEVIEYLEPTIEVLSINPMFAPSLGFEGRPVAMVELRTGPRSRWFIDILEGFGGILVPVEPDEHDQITASVQAATHAAILAFGLAVESLGHDIDRLAPLFTPPHRTMLALLARVCAADPHVYHDIQHHNPHAAAARDAIVSGLTELSELSATPDPADFGQLTARLRSMFGSRGADFERLCIALFEEAPSDEEVRSTRGRRPCAYRRW